MLWNLAWQKKDMAARAAATATVRAVKPGKFKPRRAAITLVRLFVIFFWVWYILVYKEDVTIQGRGCQSTILIVEQPIWTCSAIESQSFDCVQLIWGSIGSIDIVWEFDWFDRSVRFSSIWVPRQPTALAWDDSSFKKWYGWYLDCIFTYC